MGNRGRKTNKNLLAGIRLEKAIQFLSNFKHITIDDLIQMPEWRESRQKNGCDLPTTKKIILSWFKDGIPVEKSKIQRVSEFLKLPVNIFLHDSEQLFIQNLHAAWIKPGAGEKENSENKKWKAFQTRGSTYILKTGIASTIDSPNGCSSGWFSGNSTVILGSGEKNKSSYSHTVASWKIKLKPYWQKHFKKGFVVIGCLRLFGGLHTKKYGSIVEILFNDKHIDQFGLMVVAQNHTDYFHRISKPPQLQEIDIWPLSACQTTYAWPILKSSLFSGKFQTVTVRVENQVSWDIDYVAIVCKA